MRNIFFFCVFGLGYIYAVRGQEIIPFPDLSESHIAVYNQSNLIDEKNYSYYTKEYQQALKSIDLEIQNIDKKLETVSNPETKERLESEKDILVRSRLSILKEADLVEDLYKFY
ncbi:hypothetical protein LCM02_00525 [Lutimonas saemankumensis]|uniref:hypothetical protein n=1 Tax=Lutimonas saemankumensis TaxID=483016 RepID=UPI001CD56C04|nr:hypothetical protein [Lutimonas saemankumensis]MCA0930912.1 hypothetical protein [Lutimonas saemankumensis]